MKKMKANIGSDEKRTPTVSNNEKDEKIEGQKMKNTEVKKIKENKIEEVKNKKENKNKDSQSVKKIETDDQTPKSKYKSIVKKFERMVKIVMKK